jgi:hypothetical protein
MTISVKNSSAFACLAGTMLIMLGFNGFMSHTYSNSMTLLEGIHQVKLEDVEKSLELEEKVCVVTPIHSDEIINMPDNHQKVIKGKLYLCATWPDSSQNILIDWNKQSKFLTITSSDGNPLYINPKNIECIQDTSLYGRLKINRRLNSLVIKYLQYEFTLQGISTKGEPQITLYREYLTEGTNMAITLSKSPDNTINVENAAPYEIAQKRQPYMTTAKIVYILIALAGIAMFFIPEKQAANTIANTKNIVNKILSDIKD